MMLVLKSIQHNPIYYPDPFTYTPERWIVSRNTTTESVDLAHSAFCAFFIEPVSCVRKKLAYQELMVTIARVL